MALSSTMIITLQGGECKYKIIPLYKMILGNEAGTKYQILFSMQKAIQKF